MGGFLAPPVWPIPPQILRYYSFSALSSGFLLRVTLVTLRQVGHLNFPNPCVSAAFMSTRTQGVFVACIPQQTEVYRNFGSPVCVGSVFVCRFIRFLHLGLNVCVVLGDRRFQHGNRQALSAVLLAIPYYT